jgi:hypothetical protein
LGATDRRVSDPIFFSVVGWLDAGSCGWMQRRTRPALSNTSERYDRPASSALGIGPGPNFGFLVGTVASGHLSMFRSHRTVIASGATQPSAAVPILDCFAAPSGLLAMTALISFERNML